MKYCLYYGGGQIEGQRPRTVLAQVEARDGDTLIVRAVDYWCKPRVKLGKRITSEDVAYTWGTMPTMREVRAVRSNLPVVEAKKLAFDEVAFSETTTVKMGWDLPVYPTPRK